MEKTEQDLEGDDYDDLDDVLDQAYFNIDDFTSIEDDESALKNNSNYFRPISEL